MLLIAVLFFFFFNQKLYTTNSSDKSNISTHDDTVATSLIENRQRCREAHEMAMQDGALKTTTEELGPRLIAASLKVHDYIMSKHRAIIERETKAIEASYDTDKATMYQTYSAR